MMRDKRNTHIYIAPSKEEIVFWNVDEFLYWFREDFGRFHCGMGKQQSWPICQRRRQEMSRPMAFKETRQRWLINFRLFKFLKKCNLIGSKRKYVAFTGSMLKSLWLININYDLLTSSKTRRVRVFHDRVDKTMQHAVLGRKYVIFVKNGLNVV